jgi:hypothetical protein
MATTPKKTKETAGPGFESKLTGEKITIKGARTHTLKDVSVELPRIRQVIARIRYDLR